jgi:homospermidine synthase
MGNKEVDFAGRLVIAGFGSIGQGALPLLLRHIAMRPEQAVIIKAHDEDWDVADALGVRHVIAPLDRDNFARS